MTVEVRPGTSSCRTCRSPVFDDEQFCEACGTPTSLDVPPVKATHIAATMPLGQRTEFDRGAVAAVSDRGRRRFRNEDAYGVVVFDDRSATAVCDGVASTANGDRASRVAADSALGVLAPLLRDSPRVDPSAVSAVLCEAFAAAQQAVIGVPGDEPGGLDPPSTTMVVTVSMPGMVIVGNVGDSRAYWLGRSGRSDRNLTVDDSLAQERIAEGVAPEAAYADQDAHIITRWLGADAEPVAPRITAFEVPEPGLIVVCSDGLWNYFEQPRQVAAVLGDMANGTQMDMARRLVDAALGAGGDDNITVAVIAVEPVRLPAPSQATTNVVEK
jgi:serine/threonine protein phosphatase PrpC